MHNISGQLFECISFFALWLALKSLQGAIDIPLRLILAALALVVIFHPSQQVAWLTCIPVGLFVVYWILRRRNAPAERGRLYTPPALPSGG